MKNGHRKCNNGENWYYDACTLDKSKKTFGEIINGKKIRASYVSHLSLGEALGNSIVKNRKNEGAVESFIDLIRQLVKLDRVEVVENNVGSALFDDIRSEFTALSITDANHLAVAIENKCTTLRTTDSDLYGLDKNEVKKIGTKYGISNFSITEKNL